MAMRLWAVLPQEDNGVRSMKAEHQARLQRSQIRRQLTDVRGTVRLHKRRIETAEVLKRDQLLASNCRLTEREVSGLACPWDHDSYRDFNNTHVALSQESVPCPGLDAEAPAYCPLWMNGSLSGLSTLHRDHPDL